MYALRQIYDHATETIAVPPELQHQRIEVIFMVLNEHDDTPSLTGQSLINVLQSSPYLTTEIPVALSTDLPVRDIVL